MYKSKMANSLQRIILLATVVSAILLKAEAQDNGPVTDSGVLPVVTENPNNTVDIFNQPVSGGLVGMISPLAWPFSYSFLEVINFMLQTFANQELPCTIWSLVPPRVACTYVQ